MMRNIFIIYLLTIVHWQSTYAQFTDNFADGNFNANPAWQGDNGKFSIASGQLRLQADAVDGTAYLATANSSFNNASFEFLVQLDFNPSSANLCKVYVGADQPVLTSPLQGYFVEIGNTADEVSLYRQDGATVTKIIDGLDKTLNTSSVTVKVKVIRNANGQWQLYSDIGNTGKYVMEGDVTDATYATTSYFGVECQYTSTRNTGFHFDDFVVTGDSFKDTTPPVLNTVDVTDATTLELKFSEALQSEKVSNVQNYTVDNGIGNPLTTSQPDSKTVRLSFSKAFVSGVTNSITVKSLTDENGNVMADTPLSFMYFEDVPLEYRDVVISEIMADPDPQVKLPAAEFIELYNRSKVPVKLDGWVVTDGSSTGHINVYMLMPARYAVLTSTTNASLFTGDNVIGVPNFPTLKNSGDAIVIKTADAITIDSIHYGTTWYGDDDKKDGGWTLEKIDVNNICSEAENWTASTDDAGGTPGKQNSVFANKPDVTPPLLQSVYAESNTSIVLQFNEKLNRVVPPLSAITITPTHAITDIDFTNESLTALRLTSTELLLPRTSYTLTASNIYDCAGNRIDDDATQAVFGLPEAADSLDIVINEILFNPKPTGSDFVELYNKSEKYIDVTSWSLANVEKGDIVNGKAINSGMMQMPPHSYVAFTVKKNALLSEYPNAMAQNIIEVGSIPSMNDDEGSIAVLDSLGEVIDAFTYSHTMHSPFLQDDEGVSLERIQSDGLTNDSQNWRSASEASGFGTPGYINSNSRRESINDKAILVEPEIFDPVSVTQNFAEIKYNFDQGGMLGSVKIFDLEGREVKSIANNSSLNTQGFFRWDGDTNSGTKANVGYYVVRFEVFDSSGGLKTYHKRVVVAARF